MYRLEIHIVEVDSVFLQKAEKILNFMSPILTGCD